MKLYEFERLSRVDVMRELRKEFPNLHRIDPWDEEYAVVKADHVAGKFSLELRHELKATGVESWAPGFDCEDWSLQGLALAKRKHYFAYRRGLTDCKGVGAGLIVYPPDLMPGRHAILIFRTERGWEAYEPQQFKFITLSEEEKESACTVIL